MRLGKATYNGAVSQYASSSRAPTKVGARRSSVLEYLHWIASSFGLAMTAQIALLHTRTDRRKMALFRKFHNILVVLVVMLVSTLAFAQTIDPKDLPDEVPLTGIGGPKTAPSEEIVPGGAEKAEEGPAAVETDLEGPLAEEEMVYLNVQEADIKDVIKQISKATSRNFIIDDKIRGKITIISERPMTSEEAYQTFLSALEVAGYTTVKGPANVIKIVPLKEAAKSPIPTHVDSTPYTDSFITRLITLDNISALDMSNAIKDLISREGNLFAYPATNTLIITDSGSNIDRLMKIVKELDQEGPQQVMEIIPVKNTLASEVAKMIKELFEKEKGKKKTTRRRKGASQLEELQEVSKIIADERTNSVIVLASTRAIAKVRDIIKKLDSRMSAADEGRIHVYYLKHATAKDLAETLSALTSSSGAKKGKKGGTDIAVARFEGGVKISADESTNALIITALPKDFHTLVDKVISKLDIPRRQVYFESVVMELRLNKGSNYGVSGYGGMGAGTTIGMGQTMGGPSLLGSLVTGAAPWPAFLGGLVSSRTTDITYVGADGTSSTLTMPAFSAFISALASRGEANVVSTPNLLTLDNEEATMHVLTKEPIPGSTTFGASGVTTATSVDYKEAGLEMKIKPQITEGDMVRMEIEQKLSGFSTPSFSTALNAPAMRERKITTTVVTENGQTVVLAGLMDDTSSKTKRKIPILGDIPILGFLFSTTSNSMSKSNLLIFITPHIIKDRTDFSSILKRKIEERNNFIDSNFSKSRRRVIRDTIRTHREDLLEFRDPMSLDSGVMGTKSGIVDTEHILESKTKYKGTQPVIIAPSQDMTMRGPGLPTTPAVESSAWKPVAPPPSYKPAPVPVPAPLPTAKKEIKPTPLPTPAQPPPPVKKKSYKKPTIPTKAFNGNGKSAAKVPQWLPSTTKEEETPSKESEAETKETQSVITVPKEEANKDWKKPAEVGSGEIDLAY